MTKENSSIIGIGDTSTFASYHPIVTFIYFCAVIAFCMFSMNPIFLGISFVAGFIYSVILGGMKAAKFNFIFAVPVLVITMIINPISNNAGVTVLFYLNDNAITAEAIIYGFASAVMLVSVVMWFSCLQRIIDSDKILYLLGSAKPVLALLLSMCLRFIPLLKSRFKEIHDGQKCMGRKYPRRALIKKGRLLAKEISILISWSLEAAIDTSDSMEARGYGLPGRTNFHIFKFTRRDRNLLIAMVILILIVLYGCAMGANNIYYYPAVVFYASQSITVMSAASYGLLLVLPIVIDIRGEKKWAKLNLEA